MSATLARAFRTCVGCRERDLRRNLVRLVLDRSVKHARLELDFQARRSGRGAWLHRREECVQQAIRRSVWPRALRHTGGVDVSGLAALMALTRSGESVESG